MKTITLILLLICRSEQQDGYMYKTINLETKDSGTLFIPYKYEVNDTIEFTSNSCNIKRR